MGKISNFLLSLDVFGSGIELNFLGKSYFSTICGSLISTFLYTTFMLYSLRQGLMFVAKTDVSISSQNIIDLEGARDEYNFRE